MAKYTVTYKCGHTETVTIYGKMSDRDSKLAGLAEQECPECRKKAQEAAYAAENEAAAKKAEEANLPELTGTPKQIAWANTIRNKAIETIDEAANSPGAKTETIMKAKKAWLAAERTARYWINNKDNVDRIKLCFPLLMPYLSTAPEPEQPVEEQTEEDTETVTESQRIETISQHLHGDVVIIEEKYPDDDKCYKDIYIVGLSYETCKKIEEEPYITAHCFSFRRPVGSDETWEFVNHIGSYGYTKIIMPNYISDNYYILDKYSYKYDAREFCRAMAAVGLGEPLPEISEELEQFLNVLNEDEYVICEKLPNNRAGKVLAKGNRSGFVINGYEYVIGLNITCLEESYYEYVTRPIMYNIAEEIKAYRQRFKMSQEELATKAGLAQYQIARLESGNYGYNIDTLDKVCKALCISVTI